VMAQEDMLCDTDTTNVSLPITMSPRTGYTLSNSSPRVCDTTLICAADPTNPGLPKRCRRNKMMLGRGAQCNVASTLRCDTGLVCRIARLGDTVTVCLPSLVFTQPHLPHITQPRHPHMGLDPVVNDLNVNQICKSKSSTRRCKKGLVCRVAKSGDTVSVCLPPSTSTSPHHPHITQPHHPHMGLGPVVIYLNVEQVCDSKSLTHRCRSGLVCHQLEAGKSTLEKCMIQLRVGSACSSDIVRVGVCPASTWCIRNQCQYPWINTTIHKKRA